LVDQRLPRPRLERRHGRAKEPPLPVDDRERFLRADLAEAKRRHLHGAERDALVGCEHIGVPDRCPESVRIHSELVLPRGAHVTERTYRRTAWELHSMSMNVETVTTSFLEKLRPRKPKVHCHDNPHNRALIASIAQLHEAFRPTPWLFNEHLQLVALTARMRANGHPYCRTEPLIMADGGHTAL